MNAHWKLALAATLLALIAAPSIAQDADIADEPAQEVIDEALIAPPPHIVERGDLILRVERDGRLEAVEKVKVRFVPEAYAGTLEFTEVARRGGMIGAGETLFRFNDRWLDENLRSAQESLEDQLQRLAHAQQEQAVLVESNARRLEQAEKAHLDAQNALEVWNEYQGPRMLRGSELSLRNAENSIRNQREELAQLEAMYEGVELASETKDIVLERARRQLAVSEGWFELTRNDRIVTVEHTYPRQNRDTQDAVRYRSEELEHLRISTAIAEARKMIEIIGLERAVRDGEDRITRLEADRERLVITAPTSGLMTSNDFHIGDTANARQVLAEIMTPGRIILTFNATAADLRVLRERDAIDVTVPEFPEIEIAARIEEIAMLGQAAGEVTHFPVIVAIEKGDPMLRIGMRGKVAAQRTLGDVVLVPRKSVTIEGALAYVMVRDTDDEEPVRRDIALGASNDEFYQVVSGLEPGEMVVLPEE